MGSGVAGGIPARSTVHVTQSEGMRRRELEDMARDDLIAEVLDYLVGTRPLIRRDDQVDIAATEAIERSVGHATGLNAKLS